MIKVSDVSKIYKTGNVDTKALDNVSLTIEKGEFVAIVGSSGSGKSTLLNVMSTIDVVTEGKIEINGKRIDNISQKEAERLRLNNFGFVFQKYYLMSAINVYDNIVFPIIMSKKQIEKEYLESVVEILKISNLLDKMPNQLSGGEQQRVAIARALIHRPEIIFADEPTGNLDSNNGMIAFELLLECSKKYSQTVVFVTHNEMLADRADRKIELKDGAVVEG